MIKSVHLHNWRSHVDTKLEFNKGTNMLVGIMGSGKSSILEAICYALFGKFPALTSRKVKLSQIISQFAKDDSSFVEVKIEINGEEYSVKRSISGGKSEAALRKGDRLIEFKSEAVTRYVERILGIDYDVYVRAIYAEQNSMDYFLSISPRERKKQIDELIGIDKYEKLRVVSNKAANRVKQKIIDKERELTTLYNVEEINQQIGLIKNEINNYNRERNELNEKVDFYTNELKNLDEKLKLELDIENKYHSLKQSISSREGQIKSIKDKLKGYDTNSLNKFEEIAKNLGLNLKMLEKELNNLRTKHLDLSKEFALLNNLAKEVSVKKDELFKLKNLVKDKNFNDVNIEDINLHINDLNNSIYSLTSELSELSSKRKNVEYEIKDLERKCSQYREIKAKLLEYVNINKRRILELKQVEQNNLEWIASLREMISSSSDAADKLKEAGSVCPVCESPLNEDKKKELIDKKIAEIENFKVELEEKERELNELKLNIRDMENKFNDKEILEAKLNDVREDVCSSLEKKKVELKAIDEEIEVKNRKIAEAKNKLDVQRKLHDELEKHLEFNLKINEIEGFIAENEVLIRRIPSLEDQLKKVKDEIALREHKLKELNEKSVQLEQKIMDVKRDIEMQKELEILNLKLKEDLDNLSKLSYNRENIEMLRNKINDLNSKLSAVKVRIGSLHELIDAKTKNLENLQEQIRNYGQLKVEIDKLWELHSRLKKFNEAIIYTQGELRNYLVKSVNSVLKKLWNIIYPYKDISNIKLLSGEKDYLLVVERNGREVNVEGNLSGGERATAALALRIALSIVLVPDLSLLVLDEPTHNLDSNGVNALAEILRDKLPEIVEQAFVITHEEALKDGASGRLYMFTREQGKGAPTQILIDE